MIFILDSIQIWVVDKTLFRGSDEVTHGKDGRSACVTDRGRFLKHNEVNQRPHGEISWTARKIGNSGAVICSADNRQGLSLYLTRKRLLFCSYTIAESYEWEQNMTAKGSILKSVSR
jgi:hypothetical protein